MQDNSSSPSQPPNALRLLLVDDHPLFVEGLSATLQAKRPDFSIAHAGSLAEAKSLLLQQAETQHGRQRPTEDYDLILLDLKLPDGDGLSLISFLKEQRLFVPCAVLSASENAQDIHSSLNAGASGYITKAHSGKEVLKLIAQILNGEQVTPKNFQAIKHSDSGITPRQQEVLELLALGLANKQISRQLSLSEHTVKSHIKALYLYFDAHSRTECVSLARAQNLLP